MKFKSGDNTKDKITINCHSSIKISDDKVIYFDPYKIENKTNDADIIFITHDHYDHLDISSIKNIIKDDTTIVIPNTLSLEYLNNYNCIRVIPNKTYNILNYEVQTIPSYNINKPFHPKENGWVGYIITVNNEKIYIAGDTDITEENKKVKCDIALVPIGGKFTMTYEEASELVNIIKPKIAIPTHYGLIVGSVNDGKKFKNLLDNSIECILLIN